MASMRDIKRRKESIQSTSQITKAMKLVSTVKLQKAKGRAEETQPYFNKMYETVSGMLAKSGTVRYPGKREKIRMNHAKRCDCNFVKPWTGGRLQFQSCQVSYQR